MNEAIVRGERVMAGPGKTFQHVAERLVGDDEHRATFVRALMSSNSTLVSA